MHTLPSKFLWAAQRSSDFTGSAGKERVAILPVAAIEQHGPHLPVGVDQMIMQGMLRTLCDMADRDADFTVLPVQSIGKSDEHLPAPGTLSLPAPLAIEAWTEIGKCIHQSGIDRCVILSAHGGNCDVSGIVARNMRVQFGMVAGSVHWSEFGFPEALYSAEDQAIDIHGGDIETSLMLHFYPELVDMSLAQDFENLLHGPAAGEHAASPIKVGWHVRDLNPHGVAGNAAAATAEKGRAIAEHQASGLLAALKLFQSLELAGR